MMEEMNARLQALEEQISRSQRLESRIRDLAAQERSLTDESDRLRAAAAREQEEAEDWKKPSLRATILKLFGKLQDRQSEEERQAAEATFRYESACARLQDLRTELHSLRHEQRELRDAAREYEALLAQKRARLLAESPRIAEQILAMEENARNISRLCRELREAISACKRALSLGESLSDTLNSAGGWSTYDMLGGGLIADIAKYDELNQAQERAEALQAQLRRLHAELADVRMTASIQVEVDDFSRFADFFFDGFFTDWNVRSHITRAQEQTQDTLSRLKLLLHQLEERLHRSESDLARNAQSLSTLLING